ncbi:SRPBCC family protein [Miltoncostaea marina]|uniref:SRPBCC family protein n=1 Tax=Miltoncostaea marina TaxID=2843215 RepID=UPI001C3CD1E6|nr:SRPBCC family protein [Miltoncostaea marina]
MPAWSVTIDIDAPPDRVWALVGDPTSVPRWYPKYAAAEVDGDIRVLRTAEGGELRERLLERDEGRRFYSYTVLSGAPVASHFASFEVVAEGAGSRVRWATQAEPSDPSADLRGRLVGTQTEALERMKRIVEAGEA